MAPPRVQSGDRQITAEFLNYCRDVAAAFSTIGLGIEEGAKHQNARLWLDKCQFKAASVEDIPSNSIFGIEELESKTLVRGPVTKAVKITDAYSGSLYTNARQSRKTDEYFIPYQISSKTVYLLAVDPANPPVSGDSCQPKSGTFTVEKGGNKLLCLTTPTADNEAWFTGMPAGTGLQRLGFITGQDIIPRSLGSVELCDKDDVLNGTIVTVYNPHDVTFYTANTNPGDEAPADRVILFNISGWAEPVIFPFMLSACQQIDPTFEPVEV